MTHQKRHSTNLSKYEIPVFSYLYVRLFVRLGGTRTGPINKIEIDVDLEPSLDSAKSVTPELLRNKLASCYMYKFIDKVDPSMMYTGECASTTPMQRCVADTYQSRHMSGALKSIVADPAVTHVVVFTIFSGEMSSDERRLYENTIIDSLGSKLNKRRDSQMANKAPDAPINKQRLRAKAAKESRRYPCDRCGYASSTRSNLGRHFKSQAYSDNRCTIRHGPIQ